MSPERIEILTFKAGEYFIGIDIEEVVEIINFPKMLPIEKDFPFLEGEIRFRDENIPVISLSKKWEVLSSRDRNSIIIVIIEKNLVGILVDSVDEIFNVFMKELLGFPGSIKLRSNVSVFWAVAYLKKNIVLMLDKDRILTEQEKKILKDIKGGS
ncbi:MAG: chemotaxis protein CheW [bacterium]|nr:chemotaxis protein CheW [bacterium]